MSLAVSQLTERMYSGAKYSGFGRHKEGKLGSHSLQENLGCKKNSQIIQINKDYLIFLYTVEYLATLSDIQVKEDPVLSIPTGKQTPCLLNVHPTL